MSKIAYQNYKRIVYLACVKKSNEELKEHLESMTEKMLTLNTKIQEAKFLESWLEEAIESTMKKIHTYSDPNFKFGGYRIQDILKWGQCLSVLQTFYKNTQDFLKI